MKFLRELNVKCYKKRNEALIAGVGVKALIENERKFVSDVIVIDGPASANIFAIRSSTQSLRFDR